MKVGKIDASAFIQNNSEPSEIQKEVVRVGKLGKILSAIIYCSTRWDSDGVIIISDYKSVSQWNF